MRGSMVYFDTGLLVKLYCPEPDVEMAHQLVSRLNSQIPFTDIHSLEIRNAFRLKLFRGELELSEVRTALRVLDEDLAAGRLTKPEVDFHKVFVRSETLSAGHSAETGARSLDILHVAAALELRAGSFASLDLRQRTLARRVGLKLLPKTCPT